MCGIPSILNSQFDFFSPILYLKIFYFFNFIFWQSEDGKNPVVNGKVIIRGIGSGKLLEPFPKTVSYTVIILKNY